MLVRYVQHGPVTPDEGQLKMFQVSVNTELNDLEIGEKARIVGIESTLSCFVDDKGSLKATRRCSLKTFEH